MSIFHCENITENQFSLPEDESRHCIKVLRKKEGEIIRVTDGKGKLVEAIIVKAHPSEVICKVNQVIQNGTPKSFYIHIAIAPTKNIDRIEWFVEKSCELGIDEISFIKCKHSERKVIKTERLEKKAISAMKQSQNFQKARINELQTFDSFLSNVAADAKFIAYVDADNAIGLKDVASTGMTYCVLIGPEGDFTEKELELAIKNGFQKISLGSTVLRTETAGLIACHSLNFINNY